MLILKPLSNNKVWGTKRLHKYQGDKSIETIGSVYTVSGIKEMSNEVISGDAHKDFHSAILANPEKFGLPKEVDYPVIISFTGADKDLSIQVHPTDIYAQKNENKVVGKSESWYFIEEPKRGWIFANSLIKNKNDIKNKILNGKYHDVVGKYPISREDLVYIESGTLHALTEGSLVYEIQQSTDVTYRFYDYDRVDRTGNKRKLHLDDAINTLNVDGKVKSKKFESDKDYYEKPYILKRTRLTKEYKNETKIAQAITVTKGEMIVENKSVNQGMSIIVLPNETISVQQSAEEVIIATPRLYFMEV